jgi:hypothetical protein
MPPATTVETASTAASVEATTAASAVRTATTAAVPATAMLRKGGTRNAHKGYC